MTIRHVPIVLALAATCTIATGAAAGASPRPEKSGPSAAVVAPGAPTRLVQSTGNLYWTTNHTFPGGRTRSVVYRTSKSGWPGRERAIYTLNAFGHDLGAVTYAKVGSEWRFFVVVNDRRAGRSWITRLPEPGSTNVSIASPRLVGGRDLVAHGRYLFWADTGGVRRASLNGGSSSTLLRVTGVGRVGVAGNHVFFAKGAQIYRMDLNGHHLTRQIARPGAAVTAMYVRATTGNPIVYYGLGDGSVWSRTGTMLPVNHQGAWPGRTATSVFFDGRNVVWADCVRTTRSSCYVRVRYSAHTTELFGGNRVHDVQGDLRATFYGNATGVHRYRR
jgi:hypothetical protein